MTKTILLSFVVVVSSIIIFKKTPTIGNKNAHSQAFLNNSCVSVNTHFSEMLFYKKYNKMNKRVDSNVGESLERPFTASEIELHKNSSQYQVVSVDKTFYILKNILVPAFQVKVPKDKVSASQIDCPKPITVSTFKKETCIQYSINPTKIIHFWRVIGENQDSYQLEGIYNSYYSDLILKEGMKNDTFKFYNPDLTYPLEINKRTIHHFSKNVDCPAKFSPKFDQGQCLVTKGIVYKVTEVDVDAGLYETQKIKTVSQQSRDIASVEDLEDELLGIQKAKAEFGLKDFFFFQNDSLSEINCE